MTSPTPTPPRLGEREAVARTIRKAMRGTCTSEGAADMVVSGLIDPLRAENETLRAERDVAKAEVTKLCCRVDQMHRDWAKEGIEWLRSSDIDRLQGAEARAMTAETERDAAIVRADEARRILESLLTHFPDNGCVAHAQTSAAIRALPLDKEAARQ